MYYIHECAHVLDLNAFGIDIVTNSWVISHTIPPNSTTDSPVVELLALSDIDFFLIIFTSFNYGRTLTFFPLRIYENCMPLGGLNTAENIFKIVNVFTFIFEIFWLFSYHILNFNEEFVSMCDNVMTFCPFNRQLSFYCFSTKVTIGKLQI